MPKFNGLMLTRDGSALMAKAMAEGTPTVFTRIAVGDGEIGWDVPMFSVTALAHEVQSITDIHRKVIDDYIAQFEFTINTAQIGAGFFYRELGIFAEDPDKGEILYAYENIGQYADYMPAFGGATVVRRTTRVFVQVGNAENVALTVAPPGNVAVMTERQVAVEGQTVFVLAELAAEDVVSVNIEGAECFGFAAGTGNEIVLEEPVSEGRRVWFRSFFA